MLPFNAITLNSLSPISSSNCDFKFMLVGYDWPLYDRRFPTILNSSSLTPYLQFSTATSTITFPPSLLWTERGFMGVPSPFIFSPPTTSLYDLLIVVPFTSTYSFQFGPLLGFSYFVSYCVLWSSKISSSVLLDIMVPLSSMTPCCVHYEFWPLLGFSCSVSSCVLWHSRISSFIL